MPYRAAVRDAIDTSGFLLVLAAHRYGWVTPGQPGL